MIRLTCTKCKATLEMDEAFAGGVCRCQHCGTIQTVPANLKPSAPAGNGESGGSSSAGSPARPTAAKSLYQKPSAAAKGAKTSRRHSGLDELAGAVASSGLSG